MNKLNVVIAFFAVIALIIGMKLWHHTGASYTPSNGGVSASILSPPHDVARFSLLDTKAKPFNNSSLWAHWTFVTFGSASHCSESCAETMKALNTMVQKLQVNKQTPIPQVVFISTDAVNDSLNIISDFTAKFSPDFIGVSGDMKQVALLSQLLPADEPDAVLLIDPSGKLSGIFAKPHRSDYMVHDFKIIVQNEG